MIDLGAARIDLGNLEAGQSYVAIILRKTRSLLRYPYFTLRKSASRTDEPGADNGKPSPWPILVATSLAPIEQLEGVLQFIRAHANASIDDADCVVTDAHDHDPCCV